MGETGIEKNKQRESVYTRHLGKQIVDSFKEYNVIITSHVVAFAAFEILRKMNSDLDIFGLISLPTDDIIFQRDLLTDVIEQLQNQIIRMADEERLRCSVNVRTMAADDLLTKGLSSLGSYHVKQPLKLSKRGAIVSDSFKLLYFYHNRLLGYEFDKFIEWDESKLHRAIELTDL